MKGLGGTMTTEAPFSLSAVIASDSPGPRSEHEGGGPTLHHRDERMLLSPAS